MKKSWIITLALVLTLAVAGFTYALWQAPLFINGTVGTGNIIPYFASAAAADNESTDVASIGVVINADDLATIDIDNAYPGYAATATLGIKNKGSVPVKVTGVTFIGVPAELTVAQDGASIIGQVVPAGDIVSVPVNIKTTVGNVAQLSGYSYQVQIDTEQAQ